MEVKISKEKNAIRKINREINKLLKEIAELKEEMNSEDFGFYTDIVCIENLSKEELCEEIINGAELFIYGEVICIEYKIPVSKNTLDIIVRDYEHKITILQSKIESLNAEKLQAEQRITAQKEKYNNPEYIEYLRLQAKFNGK